MRAPFARFVLFFFETILTSMPSLLTLAHYHPTCII
jgi:hypothetical protein